MRCRARVFPRSRSPPTFIRDICRIGNALSAWQSVDSPPAGDAANASDQHRSILLALLSSRLGVFLQANLNGWDWYPGAALVIGAGGVR